MKILGRDISFGGKKELKTTDRFIPATATTKDILRLFGSQAKYIDTSTVLGQSLAFAGCSILTSIVTKKVSAITSARFWVVDEEGNDVKRPEIMDRMKQPNPYQTLYQFVGMIEFFSQVYGKAYICKVQALGMEDFELYVVPNELVTENLKTSIIPTFAPLADVDSYTLTLNGVNYTVTPENMFVVNDVTYSLNRMGGAVSRLESLEKPVNTFIASYEAVNELLWNRGMLGIISMKMSNPDLDTQMPATKSEKADLREQLNEYGVLRGQMKYAITGYDVSCVPVSSSIADLGISDIQSGCKKDIAYTYQVPGIMLDMADSKYANLTEAKLDFYTNDIIPSSANIMDVMNRIHGNEQFKVLAFYDHLDVFQEAKRKQADGFTKMVASLISAMQSGLITRDEAREKYDKYDI